MSSHSYQPRCKVCRHTGREEIDLLLATNHSFVGIEERFGLPYRSLANHRRKHLDFDDPAITAAVEAEHFIAEQSLEFGVERAVERRVMLDVCIELAAAIVADSGPPNL